jgi:hypothetical protein
MKLFSKAKILPLLAGLALITAACSSGDTGRLSMSLTDKPSDDYDAVYVTIKEIDVHPATEPDGVWTTALGLNKTINLLELANGVRENLGIVTLATGDYTQMRLIIGDTADSGTNILGQPHPAANYVIDANGVVHVMNVPSGMQTGVKLVQGFTINENGTTELTFDFDVSKSIVRAGGSGQYLLKPAIEVVDTSVSVVLGGTVSTTQGQSTVGVGGALVSVQIYDGSAALVEDQVLTKTSTFTDDTDTARGQYKFFFAVPAAGQTFNIVTTKDDLTPQAARLNVQNGTAYTQDFTLGTVSTGTANVTITGATAGQPVSLSFRQPLTLGADNVVVEIKFVSVVDTNANDLKLPVGDYTLVAWTEGKTTQQVPVHVAQNTGTAVTVAF